MRTAVWLAAGLFLGGRAVARGEVPSASTDPEVAVAAEGDGISIENSRVKVRYDLARGTYDAIDKSDGSVGLAGASCLVNKWRSDAPDLKRTWKGLAADDRLGRGRTLEIACAAAGQPSLVLQITLYEGKGFIALAGGIDNVTGKPVQISLISPLAEAIPFPQTHPWRKVLFMEGPGGAGRPRVMNVAERKGFDGINNMLWTLEGRGGRRSLVLGGLTYREFCKFASFISAGSKEFAVPNRRADLEKRAGKDCRLVCYLDCGVKDSDSVGKGPKLVQVSGGSYAFSGAASYYNTVSFDETSLAFRAMQMDPKKAYLLGFSWWDGDAGGRAQSVAVSSREAGSKVLLARQALPAGGGMGMPPEERLVALPPEAYASGSVQISFTKNAGRNAVVSELWLFEGDAQANIDNVLAAQGPVRRAGERATTGPDAEDTNIRVGLKASDLVGKLVDAGARYVPDADRFYVDFTTANPFEALEQYGLCLAAAQDARPHIYDFPTVCAWYAFRSRNHTPGVVEEMDHIAKSGFLKYSRAAVRLVPDTYEKNNEQGWWDEEHWQKFGHYKPPYETSRKYGEAMAARGGLAFTYFQVAHESQDYRDAYPERMLGNNPKACTDYTDPETIKHMRKVYANMREGGIRGMMFDYPTLQMGKMEDPHATVGYAYRTIFALAKEGLGPDSWIHERILNQPFSDITSGVVDSQRVWGDTYAISPEMVSICGLRWYKNRVLFSYDMDSKDLLAGWKGDRKVPASDRDGRRMLLTMAYVAASRLLLATSFAKMTPEVLYDLERTFPYHSAAKSARPIDAFVCVGWPQVYDFAVTPEWHQVTFYNADLSNEATLKCALSGDTATGSLGLDPAKEYYVYDFWNERLVGSLKGDSQLEQTLRPGEARMMSVRKVLNRPQFLSTSRHIMQGYVDMVKCEWNAERKSLEGVSKVVGGEPYKIVIATNGWRQPTAQARGDAKCTLRASEAADGLLELTLEQGQNGEVAWAVNFGEPPPGPN